MADARTVIWKVVHRENPGTIETLAVSPSADTSAPAIYTARTDGYFDGTTYKSKPIRIPPPPALGTDPSWNYSAEKWVLLRFIPGANPSTISTVKLWRNSGTTAGPGIKVYVGVINTADAALNFNGTDNTLSGVKPGVYEGTVYTGSDPIVGLSAGVVWSLFASDVSADGPTDEVSAIDLGNGPEPVGNTGALTIDSIDKGLGWRSTIFAFVTAIGSQNQTTGDIAATPISIMVQYDEA